MRIPSKAWLTRLVGLAAVLACALGSKSASKKPYSIHEKAYYAANDAVNFVRPGLVFKITGASIAADGTIQVKCTISDPLGLPLDRLGVNTPGPVSVSFIAATIPKGQKQYTSYTTRVRMAATGSATALQAAADTGGTFTSTADGQYTYTFNTKAPAGFDASATHTIGIPISADRREVPNALECLYATVLVMTNSIISEKLRHGAPDLLVQPKVGSFRALGFLQASAILRAADPVKAEFKENLARLLDA